MGYIGGRGKETNKHTHDQQSHPILRVPPATRLRNRLNPAEGNLYFHSENVDHFSSEPQKQLHKPQEKY